MNHLIDELPETGGNAFPLPEDTMDQCEGMTVLDFFAAAALQGIMAAPGGLEGGMKPENVAKAAYKYADAMVKTRLRL